MKRKNLCSQRARLGALMVAVGCAAAGAANASIPDANGIIHACFKSSSTNQGALRVIDTDKGQACGSSESPLQWRQTSPVVPQARASQGAAPGIILSGDFSVAATVSITAPTAGRVLVNGWTTVSGLGPDQFAYIKLRDTTSGVESSIQGARVPAGDSSVLSVGWLFEVAAGEQVYALGIRGVGGTINTGSATITAVFLPE
jgi:hypothetical protein